MLARVRQRPSKLRVNKRNRCAPFCDPGLPAWAKVCRAPTKESGCKHRTYGAGREEVKLQIANLKLEISDCKAGQRPREIPRLRQAGLGCARDDSEWR